MNKRPDEETDGAVAAADEAMLGELFDDSFLQPSHATLARLTEAATRMPELEAQPKPHPRGNRRGVVFLALAAAVAAVVGGGAWLAAAADADGDGSSMGAAIEIVETAAPTVHEQAVAGWDDAASRLEVEAGAMAMLDEDPLAAFDDWREDDLLASDAAED